jgi:carnitine-CoA ligase
VMVVVVPRDGHEVSPVDIVDHCAERMASFMVPRYVRFMKVLPKTATERVQKYLLREDHAARADAWDRDSDR